MADKPEPPQLIRGMPYTVRELKYGNFLRATRLYASGRYGDLLTDEEIAVWKVVEVMHAASLQNATDPAATDPAATAPFLEGSPVTGPKPKRK